jgi:Skp family chaperone for outer membrane proteins
MRNIEDLRSSRKLLTAEELEAEKHQRDEQIQSIQRERAELKAWLDERWTKEQIDANGKASAYLGRVLKAGGK